MRLREFKRILGVFADPGTETVTSGSEFLVEINGNVISGKLKISVGEVRVSELDSGDFISANTWIINHLAKLKLLANRLIDCLHKCADFVSPDLKVSKSLDCAFDKFEYIEENSVESIIELLENENAFSTDVFYLVSDAGEGKTTIINAVATRQAERFKAGETNQLIVPISLGGRTFLRFDDITVGVLQNRYRFPYLHYSAFIELIRMGVIVPAFDGFEEMFVETSTGEANSALGNLLNSLNSEGSMFIATRKAYFDFHDVKNQVKLFDSINGSGVEFRKIEIQRWNEKHFLDYCENCCVSDAKELYTAIANKIGVTHSLLTRPVLIKQLVKVALEAPSINDLVDKMYTSDDSYFATFVKTIIEREATEKWIDRGGDVGTPLLTIQEHCELLSEIAIEMWISKVSYIKHNVLEFVVDFYCETRYKSPTQTDQIRKRINNHALLTTSENSIDALEFDHDEFYQYFLGEIIAERLTESKNNEVDILSVFQKGILSEQAKNICVLAIRRGGKEQVVIKKLINIANMDNRASFSHSNVTYILYTILNKRESKEDLIFENMSFSAEILKSICMSNITFKSCYFESLNLLNSKLENCHFKNVRFSKFKLDTNTKMINCSIDNESNIDSLWLGDDSRSLENELLSLYDPGEIDIIIQKYFIGNEKLERTQVESVPLEDEEIKCIRKILIYFLRSTHMGENIMRMKLGGNSTLFISRVLPDLLENEFLKEIPNIGSGKRQDRRFKLNVKLEIIHTCIAQSKGSYTTFLSILKKL